MATFLIHPHKHNEDHIKNDFSATKNMDTTFCVICLSNDMFWIHDAA
ncbi:12701_t:CDS:1, partial [Cetraspora pellucida]